VHGGDPQPLDGAVPQRRRVIVEFDSPEAVTTFMTPMRIRRWLPIRPSAINGFVCLPTGGD
jgi:hypothetical protein